MTVIHIVNSLTYVLKFFRNIVNIGACEDIFGDVVQRDGRKYYKTYFIVNKLRSTRMQYSKDVFSRHTEQPNRTDELLTICIKLEDGRLQLRLTIDYHMSRNRHVMNAECNVYEGKTNYYYHETLRWCLSGDVNCALPGSGP